MESVLMPAGSDEPAYSAIATLADSPSASTCCAIVARERGMKIVAASSFEEAIEDVKVHRARGAMVPGAYPEIRKFLMDEQLKLADCFVHPIPALVYAAKATVERPDKVHAHPATSPFWRLMPAPVLAASSNQAAAASAAADGNDACITNLVAAAAFGLETRKILRPASAMSFHIFMSR